MKKMKNSFSLALIMFAFVATTNCADADNNSFFGANPGSSSGNSSNSSSNVPDYSHDGNEDNNPNAVLPGLNETTPSKPSAADFTGDEKRMQRKYKDNLANAKRLITRGTGMMNSAGGNVNNAAYKKGKILKEIGEKTLADLTANNPFPDQKTK